MLCLRDCLAEIKRYKSIEKNTIESQVKEEFHRPWKNKLTNSTHTVKIFPQINTIVKTHNLIIYRTCDASGYLS